MMKCAICGSTLPEDEPICERCESDSPPSAQRLVPDEVAGHIRAARALIILGFFLSFLFLPFAMARLHKAERCLSETSGEDRLTLGKIRRLRLAAGAVLLLWLAIITLAVARQYRYARMG